MRLRTAAEPAKKAPATVRCLAAVLGGRLGYLGRLRRLHPWILQQRAAGATRRGSIRGSRGPLRREPADEPGWVPHTRLRTRPLRTTAQPLPSAEDAAIVVIRREDCQGIEPGGDYQRTHERAHVEREARVIGGSRRRVAATRDASTTTAARRWCRRRMPGERRRGRARPCPRATRRVRASRRWASRSAGDIGTRWRR